jgi:3-hydroxyacyl-[acyl-carrier-protein] dehydratase
LGHACAPPERIAWSRAVRFLFVDRILRLEEGTEAVVRKNVSNSEDYFADHFEGRPIMPGCLILETCDQAARLLLAKSAEFAVLPSLERVANAKMQHFVQPGDLLEVQVIVASRTDDGAEVRASAVVGDRIVARASLHYRLIPATADTLTGRACQRMRGFYEELATDMERIAAERRIGTADPGREARRA